MAGTADKKRAPATRSGGAPKRRTAPARSDTPTARDTALRRYLRETRSPLTAAALSLPLVTAYGLGTLLLPETRNGADLLTGALALAFAKAGWAGWRPWAVFYGALVAVNLGVVAWLSRRSRLSWNMALPLLAECAFYAVLTGTASSWLTHHVLEVARGTHLVWAPGLPLATAAAPATPGVVAGLLISAGAGLHEELVFRLVGVGLVARLWLGAHWRSQGLPLVAVVVVSALTFAAVHHLAEPFTWSAMVFRTFAGLFFSLLYLGRGFAVAAWTHALYDAWILVLP